MQFHGTPQPIDQTCPEPIEPRMRSSIPPPATRTLSYKMPVDHRWCDSARPLPLNVQFSTTIGPDTPPPVATYHTLAPVTAQRSISTCVPFGANSAGLLAP